MSDSGRGPGDCRHGRTAGWCVECLRGEVARLRAVIADGVAVADGGTRVIYCRNGTIIWDEDGTREGQPCPHCEWIAKAMEVIA